MTKRLTTIAVALLATALMAAGCGTSGSGNATEDALSFMPKDAPVAITLQTDLEGDQYQQLDKLLKKFPFTGQVKAQAKQAISSAGYDFDKDIKPILGNDLVITIPTTAALHQDDTPAVGAIKAKDEGKAEDFIKKDGTKVGQAEGEDVYRSGDDTFLSVKDGVVVITDSLADMQAAMKRHSGDDHMTEDDLDSLLAGVEGQDGAAKVGVDLQAVIAADPEGRAAAQKVKWVGGLRDLGATVAIRDDGIEENFKLTTEGVSDQDLPLAPGADAAPVVRRATDVGLGMRDLGQVFHFFESTGQATNPRRFARYKAHKAKLSKTLGIDIDKDVIDQLEGEASLSVGLDGGFAVRSSLKDPDAFKATLRKAAPKLAKALKGEHVGVVTPKKPDGFYALATADGKKYVFAVIDDKFVLATDAARAAQFASQSATPVPDAKGSLVFAADARAIANEAARKQGQAGAQLFTGALGEVTGWVETETDGMTGRLRLGVK